MGVTNRLEEGKVVDRVGVRRRVAHLDPVRPRDLFRDLRLRGPVRYLTDELSRVAALLIDGGDGAPGSGHVEAARHHFGELLRSGGEEPRLVAGLAVLVDDASDVAVHARQNALLGDLPAEGAQ